MKSKTKPDNIIPIHITGFGTKDQKEEIDNYYRDHLLTKGYDAVSIILDKIRERRNEQKIGKGCASNSARIRQEETNPHDRF